jgi:hypothetical protein
MLKKIKKLFFKKNPTPSASPAASGLGGILGKDWEQIKKYANAPSHVAPRVLLATSMGAFQAGTLLESTLAVALTLRGAKVDVLLDDAYLPACQITTINVGNIEEILSPNSLPFCDACQTSGRKVFEPLGLPIYWYSQLVTKEQETEAQHISQFVPYGEIEDFRLNDLAVGEHALAGALRYFARGDLHNEPAGETILRLYLKSALLTVYVIRALLKKNKYDVACFNHGIYTPQGLIGEVCRQQGVRVVNWNPAYRKHSFVFSHDDSYHHTMITESVAQWEDLPWSQRLEAPLMEYLESRKTGAQDWIWFHEKPEEKLVRISEETGVDFSKPVIGALTSVMWDAKLHYKSNAFSNMVDWIKFTIEYFTGRPDLQLLIRVHPAEVRGTLPSRQPLMGEIKRLFPVLPPNVFVIPPESQVSTYAVIEQCDTVIIYNTKTGIEASSVGIPVIVAGEAWIRNKGFTSDASSPEMYRQLLDQLPVSKRMSPAYLERARKYAFHFFFRRMIPLPFIKPMEPKAAKMQLDITRLEELKTGHFKGLDIICAGILEGTEFEYPAEMYVGSEQPDTSGGAQ